MSKKKKKDITERFFGHTVSNTGKISEDDIKNFSSIIHSFVERHAKENNLEISFERSSIDYYYFIFRRFTLNHWHYSKRFKYPMCKEDIDQGYKKFDEFIKFRMKEEQHKIDWNLYILGKMN